jgi:hypothetical protein
MLSWLCLASVGLGRFPTAGETGPVSRALRVLSCGDRVGDSAGGLERCGNFGDCFHCCCSKMELRVCLGNWFPCFPGHPYLVLGTREDISEPRRCSRVDGGRGQGEYVAPVLFLSPLGPLFSLWESKKTKTYNTWDSLVVTDPTTDQAVTGLSMGERTGSRIFQYLWSYVFGRLRVLAKVAAKHHGGGSSC